MKNKLAIFLLTFSVSVQASLIGVVQKKITDIDTEMEGIKKAMTQDEDAEIYRRYLGRLEKERMKYLDFLSKLGPDKNKGKKKLQARSGQKNTIPRVVEADLKNLERYEDESLPVVQRYELILTELADNRVFLEQMREIPPARRTEQLLKTMTGLEEKIERLEQNKAVYEVKIREVETHELAEMKKSGVRVGAMFDFYYQWAFTRPSKNGPFRTHPLHFIPET